MGDSKIEMDKELSRIKSETAIFEKQEENRMNEFARQLNGELGESMINELRNPERQVVHKGFMFSLKKWWRELTENFKIMFYNVNE